MASASAVVAWVLAWACVSVDQRDVVRFVDTDRKPLECRVIQRFEGDYIVDVGGKRRTIRRDDVSEIDTVNDRIHELVKRSQPEMPTEERMALARWAGERAIPEMAALCAYRVLLEEPEHDEANEFLGHRSKDGKWLWPIEGRYVPPSAFDRALRSSRMLELESEHFVVETDVGLACAVNTLFDLERFYVDWRAGIGKRLRAVEVLGGKMRFTVYRSSDDFPAKSSRHKVPYFDPAAGYGHSFTYMERGDEWPRMLFSLATQQLFYTSLLPSMGASDAPRLTSKIRHRDAVWLEIGFGDWMDSQVEGPPGYGSLASEPAISREAAKLAFRGVTRQIDLGAFGRWHGLEDLIGWHFDRYYESTRAVDFRWDVSAAFVHFLMDEQNGVGKPQQSTREALLNYIAQVYREGKGGGSSLFDEMLGFRVESLDRPFKKWLSEKSK